MSKFLLLLVIGCVLWWLWHSRRRSPERPQVREEQAMVACAHCGVYLPVAESLAEGDLRYCSPDHRSAGARKTS